MTKDLIPNEGRRLVLFGPNGAGKTTLLRQMWRDAPAAAYLPQRPWMFRGSGRRNLVLGLGDQAAEQAHRLAAQLGLSDAVLERPAATASGGERQRIALARTLSVDAPIVLLDEPLAPIEMARRLDVAEVIGATLGERAAVIVTHDRTEAGAVGDDAAVVLGGEVVQRGPVEEVFALPATPDVAAVVGVSNLLHGEVVDSEGELVLVRLGPLEVWGMGPASGAAVAMFGAESVTVHRGETVSPGSARNTWKGRVESVRSVGALREVVVDAGVRVVALLTPGSIDALGVGPGIEVTLVLKATAVRVAPRR